MSNGVDDWAKHINSELARIDENNRKLSVAQNKLFESSLMGLLKIGIDLLEKAKEIDSKTANIMRTSVSIIDNIVKFCFGWF
ncbi:MAG: hypothetical protein U7127_29990 [Phormidium sp.]